MDCSRCSCLASWAVRSPVPEGSTPDPPEPASRSTPKKTLRRFRKAVRRAVCRTWNSLDPDSPAGVADAVAPAPPPSPGSRSPDTCHPPPVPAFPRKLEERRPLTTNKAGRVQRAVPPLRPAFPDRIVDWQQSAPSTLRRPPPKLAPRDPSSKPCSDVSNAPFRAPFRRPAPPRLMIIGDPRTGEISFPRALWKKKLHSKHRKERRARRARESVAQQSGSSHSRSPQRVRRSLLNR